MRLKIRLRLRRVKLRLKRAWLTLLIRYDDWRINRLERDLERAKRERALAEWRENTTEDDQQR